MGAVAGADPTGASPASDGAVASGASADVGTEAGGSEAATAPPAGRAAQAVVQPAVGVQLRTQVRMVSTRSGGCGAHLTNFQTEVELDEFIKGMHELDVLSEMRDPTQDRLGGHRVLFWVFWAAAYARMPLNTARSIHSSYYTRAGDARPRLSPPHLQVFRALSTNISTKQRVQQNNRQCAQSAAASRPWLPWVEFILSIGSYSALIHHFPYTRSRCRTSWSTTSGIIDKESPIGNADESSCWLCKPNTLSIWQIISPQPLCRTISKAF